MNFTLGSSTREAYGKTLARLGDTDPNIVVLDADLAKSTMTKYFGEAHPDRFFYVGVAEQNMLGMAAGLAACGKTVFASTFAVFATRAFDQLRILAAQAHANVKLVASHAGVVTGEDGKSAHGIEDLALMGSFPGFTIIVPADEIETAQAVEIAARTPGPFYIRCGRPKVPVVYDPDYRFVLGKAALLRDGNDATIIANGVMLAAALEAAERLSEEHLSCRVLSMPTVKPLDIQAVILAAEETGAIVVAEEHLQHGGLGSEIAQVVGEHCPVPLSFVALKDRYAESGKPEELLRKYGLTADDVVVATRSVIEQKRRFER